MNGITKDICLKKLQNIRILTECVLVTFIVICVMIVIVAFETDVKWYILFAMFLGQLKFCSICLEDLNNSAKYYTGIMNNGDQSDT